MIFFSILLAVFLVYLLQAYIYTHHAFDHLEYRVYLSAEEVFEDEDIFMYEEIINRKLLPLPYLKVDTELPQGLKFLLTDHRAQSASRGRDAKRENFQIYESYVESIFVMRGYQIIRRRWRISCTRRGVYSLGRAVIVSNDLFGFNTTDKVINLAPTRYNRLVVLPRSIDLEKHFISAYYHTGDIVVPRSLLTDPAIRAGTREYTTDDPMSRINWKSTAVHDRLMVNIEEHTQKNRFNVIMNMQSRPIELHPHVPSAPELIEMCVTVCASIMELVSAEDIPVTIYANTDPEPLSELGAMPAGDDEVESQILRTRGYCGKQDTLHALRLLSALPMTISCPVEKMLDHVTANPHSYASGDNIIVVSPYICERMIVFYKTMARQNVRVTFYITGGNQNAMLIPPYIPVYYRLYKVERN